MTVSPIRSVLPGVTQLGCFVAAFSLFAVLSAPAQDLAEIARQQRAQRDAHPQHVYTNDDLKRTQILTPEDRQRAEADKASPAAGQSASAAAPGNEAAAPQAPGQQTASESLGDLARRFQALKLDQERLKKERLARLKNPLPLELPPPELIRQPSLAYPMFPAPGTAEPGVKVPMQPALVAPRAASRRSEVPVAPAAPPVRAVLPAISGNLAAAPVAPFAAPRAARSRARLEIAAAPAAPASHAALPAISGNLTAAPTAPLSPLSAAHSYARSDIPAPPTVPFAAPALARPLGALSLPLIPRSQPRSERSGQGPRVILLQPGDTLWHLARKYLGRGQDWPQLAAANPQLSDPERLQPGTSLRLPPIASQERVRVHSGDTLSRLARAHFGSIDAWHCLAEANPQIADANVIFAGQAIAIPASCDESSASNR